MLANFKPILPDDEEAEEVALEVLMWLAEKLDLMHRFLKLTGIPADNIRSLVGSRSFYTHLLAFIANHESTLMDFCQDKNINANWVEACRAHFCGVEVSRT